MLLTHNEDGQPTALFVDHQDRVQPIPIIMDERMFSDSVLRVVRLSPALFLVYDIRYLNGTNVFEKLHFEDRQQLIANLLETFHTTDLTALLTIDDAPETALPRGTEHYDWQPGSLGVFLPAVE